MIKSRWIRILVKIILIGLVITGYFYFQKPIIYRYRDVNAIIPIGDMQLIIEEINVQNRSEETQYRYLNEEWKIPWAYRVLYDSNLPSYWMHKIVRVISFYSRPALSQDYGTLQVYGVLIHPEETDLEKLEFPSDRIHLYVYTGCMGGGGMAAMHRDFENFYLLCEHDKFDLTKLNQRLVVNVKDTETSITTQMVVSPKWQKERLFRPERDGNSPTEPVHDFLYQIRDGQPRQALNNVLPEQRGNFTIPELDSELTKENNQMQWQLEWLDVYQDYIGVYKVEGSLAQPDDGLNPSTPVHKITFFTIKDQDGNYKIIHVRQS